MYYTHMNKLDDTLVTLLLNSGKAVIQRLDAELAPIGLTTAKLWALHSVMAGWPVAMGVLAERMSSAKSNITTMVDRLEADGVLSRAPSATDRRAIEISVTAKGKRLYRDANGKVEEVEQELKGFFSDQEVVALRRAVESLITGLEKK
jgi:DNA-binding MarR family transcriptional regulator